MFVIWFIDRSIPIVRDYFEYRRLKSEGVVFMGNNTYSLIRDMILLKKTLKECPSCISFKKMFQDEMKVEQLPKITAKIFMGQIELSFNSAD